MTFEEAMAFALTLPGTEQSTSYRQPCVKANGNGFLFVGHEPRDAFALHIAPETKQIVLETHPGTFFETPHYAGSSIVLVRYHDGDDELVRDLIARAASWARQKAPPPKAKQSDARELTARRAPSSECPAKPPGIAA